VCLVEPEGSVRVWRSEVAGGCLCMSGTTTGYAVEPAGEYVVGVVLAGAMRVRRGRERLVFGPGDVCAWDPSAAHRGTAYGCRRWTARLVVLEPAALDEILGDRQPLALDLRFPQPLIRDVRLAQRFVELHRALETRSWALERDTLLADWLHDAGGGAQTGGEPRRARRDPALRRACELLHDELPANVTLAELERAAGVSRHRLSRLFRVAFGMPPHRFQLAQRIRLARRMLERGVAVADVAQATGFFDQSHLHRHFRATLGMTPAGYARRTAQTYKTSLVR
jgi:AraC-like DNA-binding protein